MAIDYTPHPTIVCAKTVVPSAIEDVDPPPSEWMIVRNGRVGGAMCVDHSRLGTLLNAEDFCKWFEKTKRKYLLPTSYEVFYLNAVDREVVAELLGDMDDAELDRDMGRYGLL